MEPSNLLTKYFSNACIQATPICPVESKPNLSAMVEKNQQKWPRAPHLQKTAPHYR